MVPPLISINFLEFSDVPFRKPQTVFFPILKEQLNLSFHENDKAELLLFKHFG